MQIGQIGQILYFVSFKSSSKSLCKKFQVARYIDNIFEIFFAKALVVSSSPLLGGSIKIVSKS